MTENGVKEPTKAISRRDFLKLAGATAGSFPLAQFLAACQNEGIKPGESTCSYDNSRNGWTEDAREGKVWEELVGAENPRAKEGYRLIFVGGIYLPPELIHFRTTPSFERHYETTGLITSSDPNYPNNNVIDRNPAAGGVLVINPVVVERTFSKPENSVNEVSVPAPSGVGLDAIGNRQDLWVAMATKPLMEYKVIGHNERSRRELTVGSAVTFANIALDPVVSLIPPAGETSSRLGTYDGSDGFWRYGRLFAKYNELSEDIAWIEPGGDGVIWDGRAALTPTSGVGIVRVGEILRVDSLKEAEEKMRARKNPLKA
jgi:hypothetical protein